MNSLPFPKTAAFALYGAQLRELNTLMSSDQDDTPVADELRDRMDSSFKQLTHEQVSWLEGMSEDLYTLSEDTTVQMAAREEPSAEEKLAAQKLARAYQAGDWVTVLRLLRSSQILFPPDTRAYIRFSAYRALGEPETALLFIVRAAQLAPSNLNYHAMALHQYVAAGDLATAWSVAKRYLLDPESEGRLVIAAADVATDWIDATNADSTELELVVAALERVLPLGIDGVRGLRSILTQGHVLLGMCYRRLGRIDEAIGILTEAIKLDPQNDAIYAARGLSMLPRDTVKAAADFIQAVELKTRIPLPYLFLAPYFINSGRLEAAEQCARNAWELAKEPTQQADALLWLAVCTVERGDFKAADGLFAQAQALDPLNVEIVANRAEFQRLALESGFGHPPSMHRRGHWQQTPPEVFARRVELSGKLAPA